VKRKDIMEEGKRRKKNQITHSKKILFLGNSNQSAIPL
jgi:hypothetical protein